MTLLVFAACLLTSVAANFRPQPLKGVDPDAFLSFDELCIKYGFNVESHYVTTLDGYILRMFHIGANQTYSSGTPVLMQHGLLDSSDTFIVNTPNEAPGFALAMQGYDVWLGNSRGNKYSRNHTTYNPDNDKAFWEFSWDQMASMDVPAQVDFVLSQTGHSKLVYIGHSQGTTQMFAHLSEDDTFAEKLHVAVMLNPVASVVHQASEVLALAGKPGFMELAAILGLKEFMPASNNDLMAYVCYYFDLVCKQGLYLLADEDLNMDNYRRLDVVLNHYPAGTSLRDMAHWSQMFNLKTESLQKYDFGPLRNLKEYGQEAVPKYDLTAIKGKIALFAGTADRLADVIDVNWLLTQLPAESLVYSKFYQNFGHASFIWGNDFSWFTELLNVIQQATD